MLNITNETGTLKDLYLCRGTAVPPFDRFESDHPEFETFQMQRWDTERLLEQQERFYELMADYDVQLHFMPHSAGHPWQMYTRDVGFVIESKLYFSRHRELPERDGEIDLVRRSLPQLKETDLVEIAPGRIEGGDVLVDEETVFVGLGTRTTREALDALARYVPVTPLYLGPRVMHLDTRMTILPGRHLLICPSAFLPEDLERLLKQFKLIEVSCEEAVAMGTNVFVINPETVVVHRGFERIAQEIEARGLKAERLDFSEPNALLGSFRCATMPLARA